VKVGKTVNGSKNSKDGGGGKIKRSVGIVKANNWRNDDTRSQ
jgi:hypothetical protein